MDYVHKMYFTDEVGNKHIARTHHYLYNITHDQGLDTIIYVPFLERILSGVSGRIYTVYPGRQPWNIQL